MKDDDQYNGQYDDDIYMDGRVEGAGVIVAVVCVMILAVAFLFSWLAS